VVHAWPHDRSAFTEGLVYRDGDLLESTGLNGKSTFRDVDLETGRVLKSVSLPREYFGEGLAVIGTRAFQLTWRNQKGFIYDVATFRAEGEFSYEGEGWGLTTDGRWLIMSDGTSRIRFIDPSNFKVVRTIEVTSAGAPVDQLNELEWVKGEIFANVWQTDRVVRIDPSTGAVRGIVDFSGLLDSGDRGPDTDVLNGIAYDATRDRLYVTGKCWPKLFEVRLIRKP
jgi:glutamine cyclotransferase